MSSYLDKDGLNYLWNQKIKPVIPTKTSDIINDSGYITSGDIPSKTSDLINDSGFISTETDPTVPSWAKAQTKPSYTAAEVGALPDSTEIPSNTSDLINDSGFMNAAGILNLFYPVGSYYETSDASFDPNTAWGGTWVLETEGMVHIGAGSNYTAGATGGEATVTLTKAQSGLPAHAHGFTQPTVSGGAVTNGITGGSHHHANYRNKNVASGSAILVVSGSVTTNPLNTTETTHTHNLPAHTHSVSGGAVSQNTGADASQAHNNMQPYIVVNRWHRTA